MVVSATYILIVCVISSRDTHEENYEGARVNDYVNLIKTGVVCEYKLVVYMYWGVKINSETRRVMRQRTL